MHKHDVVCLMLYIRSLCGHNFLERKRNILRTLGSLADDPCRIQCGVGVGALSEGDGLQHSNIIAVFHDKTAWLLDITDDVKDTRFAHQNCLTRLKEAAIIHT